MDPWTIPVVVHGGPAAPSSTGALTVRRYGAPKLTTAARGGRGQWRGAHRGQNRVARWRGCAGGGEEWNTASVLGVGRLGARINGARWGKMLWVKWPWLWAPFIASGRRVGGGDRSAAVEV
jgi:hypothetical protein